MGGGPSAAKPREVQKPRRWLAAGRKVSVQMRRNTETA